jgi:hypothetical protein
VKNKIDKSTENRLSLYKVILTVCVKNVAILMLFTGIYDIYLGFKTRVEGLESLIQQKLLISSGLSKDKQKTKLLLAGLAKRIAGSVHIYASQTDNTVLMEMMDFTKSELKYERDSALVEVCVKIYDTAMLYAGNLIVFGVDANMLLTFQTSINLYADKSPLPYEARDHKKTLTLLVKEKIREITDYKKHQMDNAIILLETTHPAFVSEYHNASRVIADGTRHEKVLVPVLTPEEVGYIAVNVTDKDGNPVEGVAVTLTSGDKVMVDETDEDGEGYHEKVTVGKWTMTIEMYGYLKITVEDLEFTGNDEMEMDFVLEDDVVPPVES